MGALRRLAHWIRNPGRAATLVAILAFIGSNLWAVSSEWSAARAFSENLRAVMVTAGGGLFPWCFAFIYLNTEVLDMMIFSRLAHKYDLEQARKEARKEAAEEAAAAVAAAQKEAVAAAQKEAAAAVAAMQKEAAQREQQWLDWNARRELAAERGEPFNEPPPGSPNGPVG